MGHGASLEEAPKEETPIATDGPGRKEAFAANDRPPSSKSIKDGKNKDGKNKEEPKRKQSKDNSHDDKDKENVLRAKVMSIASATMKGPGKLRLRRQRSGNLVTPIAAIHSDGSAPQSANSSRGSSANKQQQPLFSKRKDSVGIGHSDPSVVAPNGRAPRASSANERTGSDDRPPSGRSTPKLSRPRSRRHSRTAVTPSDSPTAQRSPERDPNAAIPAFSTQTATNKEQVTTVEDID